MYVCMYTYNHIYIYIYMCMITRRVCIYAAPTSLAPLPWGKTRALPGPSRPMKALGVQPHENMVGVNMVLADYHQNTLK